MKLDVTQFSSKKDKPRMFVGLISDYNVLRKVFSDYSIEIENVRPAVNSSLNYLERPNIRFFD